MSPDKMREKAAELEFDANELDAIVRDLDAAISKGTPKGEAIFDVLRSHMIRKAEAFRDQATSLYESASNLE